MTPLMTAQDLADYLRIPLQTLYTWRCRGDGPPGLKVGRHLRYRSDDVEQWLGNLDKTGGRNG